MPELAELQVLTGGEAVAHAMRQIDPDVIPVYPITPQTPIIQGFAKFVADGKATGGDRQRRVRALRERAEAYDLTVMAPRIAEHPDVLLPVLVGQDGFTITHSAEPVELLGDADVREFVGAYSIPFPPLDISTVTSQGPFAMPDSYFELRPQKRFAHLFEDDASDTLAEIQRRVDADWAALVARCGA